MKRLLRPASVEMAFSRSSVLVTGGGSGIGAAVARAFAAQGARVVVGDLNASAAEGVAMSICEAGGLAVSSCVDVTDASQCAVLVELTLREFGSLDIAVNSAGVSVPGAITGKLDTVDWNRVLNVNLNGVFHSMQAQLQAMRTAGGTIVNLSSIMGLTAAPGISPYCASKHGVVGLTRSAALEYGRYGIRINAICPGFIDTPMTQGPGSPLADDILTQWVSKVPLGRLGRVEEIAEPVLWLASEHASFITGTTLVIDGGVMAGS